MRKLFISMTGSLLLLLSSLTAKTQVSGKFESLSVADFIRELEKQTDFHFYYKAGDLDSVLVNTRADNESMERVLKKAFDGSKLNYAIRGKSVFITKGVSIAMQLPEGLLPAEEQAQQPLNTVFMSDPELSKTVKAEQADIRTPVEIGTRGGRSNAAGNIVTGYIRNARTGEPVANASVYTDSIHGTVSDAYGYYSLRLPAGKTSLNIQVTGMYDIKLPLVIYTDGKLDVEMKEQVRSLKEVIVSASKSSNVRSVQMGVEKLTIENIRNVPSLFGEADVMRVMVTLPGVKTVGEASTGFNVRGGSVDQNLVLYNEGTIYNPSHFFGLFSAFNPEIIQDIELYKSSMPAAYGGRLASVLEITGREGNKKNLSGSAGIGVVTSRIHLEGPLVKDRTSFILGARTTYANWLLNLLPDEFNDSRASFQDVNLSVTHRIDSSNQLYFTGYFSNDKFSIGGDTTYGYSNRNLNIKWKHTFTNRLNATTALAFDQYKYDVDADKNPVNAFRLGFAIQQLKARVGFDYFINSKHSLDFGISSIRYQLKPGYIEPQGKESVVTPDEVQAEYGLESAAYLTHRFNITPKWSLSSGIRYSMFNYLGPKDVNRYAEGQPVTESNLLETVPYGKGKFIKTYGGPELRLSTRYSLSQTFSVKASYNTLRQYIHLLSNTTIVAPTDIWKLSDPNIRPQLGEQVSFGLYKNFKENTIETSAEVYYKKITDYLDYRPGASLLLNHHIETEVINTKGKAYGLELLIKKPAGKLNGWISYTYSRIFLRTKDSAQGVVVNKGEFYPANYDKPHDFTLTGNFKVNHRFNFSLNTTYSTGRPITVPVGRYYYGGSQRVLYSDRNAYRIPDYFRMDMSMNIEGNHKVNQRTHNSWTIGIYNMLGRRNPYSVYFVTENGVINGYKLSIFGSAIPFVNFNIRF